MLAEVRLSWSCPQTGLLGLASALDDFYRGGTLSSLAEPYIRAARATSQYIGVTFSIAFGYDGSVGFVIPSCEGKMPRPEQITRSDPGAAVRSSRGA